MLTEHKDLQGRRVTLLGAPSGFVARQFAELFTSAGAHVDIVTWEAGSAEELFPGVQIHRVELPRRQFRNLLQRGLQVFQRVGQKWSSRQFTARTGKSRIDCWDQDIVYPYLMRGPMIRAVRRSRPDLVLGIEAASYGLVTRLFDGPRVISPFGSDIFFAAETWPVAHFLISDALRHATKVVSASTPMAEHLRQRFRLRDDQVSTIFSGVSLAEYRRPTLERLFELRQKWGLPPQAVILANCRRFRPHWGGENVRQVFLELAMQCPDVHFLLMRGGDEADELIHRTRQEVIAGGRENQFTFLQRDVSGEEYRELATLSDVFVSLMGLGDLRSKSIVEFAAGGSIPVIARQREYELMCERGFAAILTPPDDIGATVKALLPVLRDETLRCSMREQNELYLETYEDAARNRESILDLFAGLLGPRQ